MTAAALALLLVAAAALPAARGAASLTLAVDSADARALPSLAAARAALRSALLAHGGDASVTITLAPGVHRVPAGGLRLSAADSPLPGRRVTWRGAPGAVVSGGEPVTGWAPAADPALPQGVFRAPLPANVVTSRQLYVNGRRADLTSRAGGAALPGLALDADPACPACAYTVGVADPLQWSNPEDVEFVWSGVASGWSESRCAVASVSASGGELPNCAVNPAAEADCGSVGSTAAQCAGNRTPAHPSGCCWHPGGLAPSGHYCVAPAFPGVLNATRIAMQQPCLWNLVNRPHQPYGGAPPTTVRNVRQHLDTPGQWYLDRAAGEVLYFPLPGEDMASAAAVVAVEESLVALEGAARQAFEGVTFSFATWMRPRQGAGFVDQQAGACNVCDYGVVNAHGCGGDDVYEVTPGSVALTAAREIAFDNCSFAHLGAYAASARGGSRDVAFRGCAFSDVSGGAVMLGDTGSFAITDPQLWDANLTVADCRAANVPAEFTGATTLFAAYVADTTIEHNLIENASYSALTLGWGWGREASRRGGNRVLGNRVLGAQTARCCDGGGLYTLGPQPGSELSGNYIAQGAPVAWGPAAGNGIYHDNGSGGFKDTGNVIDGSFDHYFFQDDSDGPFGPGAQCPGRDGQPADCGMAFTGNFMRVSCGGTTSHLNTTFANNTIVAPGAPLPAAALAIVAAAGPRY